jgi:hypothetical protein
MVGANSHIFVTTLLTTLSCNPAFVSRHALRRMKTAHQKAAPNIELHLLEAQWDTCVLKALPEVGRSTKIRKVFA